VITVAFVPTAHQFHRPEIPCGCWVGKGSPFTICQCGAAYTDEAATFPSFRCYDCGRCRQEVA